MEQLFPLYMANNDIINRSQFLEFVQFLVLRHFRIKRGLLSNDRCLLSNENGCKLYVMNGESLNELVHCAKLMVFNANVA